MSFWNEIGTKHFSLAPMEDVTDTAFRQLVAELSDAEVLRVLFTEFMSTDGFMHEIGKARVSHRIFVSDNERKILKDKGIKLVAQIWGTKPENFYKTAKEIGKIGHFDGIDINMGCPVKNVVKQGACSALIGTPELAKEIIAATKEGAEVPVSIKTRMGLKTVVTQAWAETLLGSEPAAITIHGRLQKDFSELPANWDEVAKFVQVRNSINPNIPIIGNGDISSYQHGIELAEKTGVDGLMIGRGIFANPWFFNKQITEKSQEEKIQTLIRHIKLFDKAWKNRQHFSILRRFFKIYINGFAGASQLRVALIGSQSSSEALDILSKFDNR